ncbi:polysaccharide deacetylase family protein [Kribbella sp. NPDC051718]|uniref:polysaccharide deacetylase family protein n=1 Tax=Kribbella sp. NPDC051718 TaxID=3155168 RepID=UPI003426F76E
MRHRFAVLCAAVALAAGSLVAILQPATAATNTIVSLTFDDGQASQISTLPMLQSRGMRGTYYINSGWVGDSDYYMTWPEIHSLADAGNEIGSHTVHHTVLTNVSTATATREVCDDRTNIVAQGFPAPVSFAYPEAEYNNAAKQVVQSCGMSSARGVGGVSEDGCDDCPYAESVPPVDPMALQTPQAADQNTTVAQLQSYVTAAESHGGGWVVLTFHGVCSNGCADELSFDPARFTTFLDWLKAREGNGTVVRTVGDVMGASSGPPPAGPPITSIACGGTTCSTGWYRSTPVDVALSTFDPDNSAVASTRYTTDGSDPTSSATAADYTGPFTVDASTTVQYYSTDVDGNAEPVKSQSVRIDAVAPTVELTSPVADSSYRRGTSIPLSATAADTDGSGIARVVFRDGSSTLRTDTSAPYSWNWSTSNNTRTGAHTLTAVATDAAGNTLTSASVTINITRR